MNLQSFDLNLLKVLDALLRDASTTRAGARIGLSQPAVSAALGRLRAAFGDPLFVRDGQALRPTEFALSLVTPLQHLLEDTNQLLARPAFDPSTATDLFRISAADFFTEMLLPDLTARLERDAPGVKLRYTDAISTKAIEDMREGRLDLIILPRQTVPSWLESEPLFRSDFCVVARRDHPELARHGVIRGQQLPVDLYCRLRHAVFRVVEDQTGVEDRFLAKLGHTLHIALSVPSFTAVWRAVAATDLVGMIPRRLAERVAGPARLEVYAMPFAMPRDELCQAWHRRNSTARGLAWLRAQVSNILSKLDDGPNPV
ncbi:LysR family transcriptional regulator [Tabrizicola sp.]|uniref:LysR family transcriptional regulator n=1 Tax=Tabrizicola sp. TaxID=2005166 RepID=UPI003F372F8B